MVDEFERRRRRDLIAATWAEVPRHQLRWRCAAEFQAAVERWTPDRSLVLLGVSGTGKTSACVRLVAALCKRAVELGGDHIRPARSLCWVDADDLTDAGSRKSDGDQELLRRAGEAAVLVLDDVATPSKTMLRTLRGRLRRRLPTVLTSGVETIRELSVALGGEAVVRHVVEATGTRGSVVVARSMKNGGSK